jgi:hypothetical protein
LREKLRPSGDKNRIAILFALADVVGKPDVLRNGDAKAQAIFWMAYHADLGHLPAAVLSRACAAWRRSGEAWFPTTGQLLNLAKRDDDWRHEMTLLAGLERLSKARSEEPFRDMTDEERAEISRRIAALRQRPGAPIPDGPGDDERNTAALERIKQAAARNRRQLEQGAQ